MKKFLTLLLALLFLTNTTRADSDLGAGDVPIPFQHRVYNATGSQCCWCSLETLGRNLELTQLYDLTKVHKGASDMGEMTSVLRARGVKYVVVRDEKNLRAAIQYKLGVAIFIPGHCCVLIGLSDSEAHVISNNHKEMEVQKWPRAQFNRLWQGIGCVLYPAEYKVVEPTRRTATYAGCKCEPCPGNHCSCGCILAGGPDINIQVGPRPAVPAYPHHVPPAYYPYYTQPYPAYPYYFRPGVYFHFHNQPRYYHHPIYAHPHKGRYGFRATREVCDPAELTTTVRHTIADTAVSVQQGSAGGSGTVIDYDAKRGLALIASAAHVFKDLGKAHVKFPDGVTYEAQVVYLNPKTDAALLEAVCGDDQTYTGLSGADPAPGTQVYKLGFPAYARGKLNVRTCQVRPHDKNGFLFESSCYVQPGDSGGGVFLEDGSLCSVVTGYYGPQGRLDPTFMYGSGTAALQDAVKRLRTLGGYDGWRTDLKRCGVPRVTVPEIACPICPSPGAQRNPRAVFPWNRPERHSPGTPPSSASPPSPDPGTLPPPKWRQPEPSSPGVPSPAPPQPALPFGPEITTPPDVPPVQTVPTAGFVVLGLLAAKLLLLLLARRRVHP